MEKVRYNGIASGRVQGVGFRMFVRQNATDMGLDGWVKNLPDGTVEMEVQGDEATIDKFVELIKQGSYFIKVNSLELTKIEVQDETGFKIVH